MRDLNKTEKLIVKSLSFVSVVLVNTVLCYTVINIIAYIFGIPYMPWLISFILSTLGMFVALILPKY